MIDGTPKVLTLAELNALSPDDAVKFFLSCCGSERWARNMAECRPFWNLHVVFNAAETIWQYLTPEDWREALRGRNVPGAPGATAEVRADMERYETKFGYGFLHDPEQGGGEDILPALRRRLEHPLQYEITVAAAEEGHMMRREIRGRIRG